MWVAKAESERSELENTFHEKIPALEGNDKKKKKKLLNLFLPTAS